MLEQSSISFLFLVDNRLICPSCATRTSIIWLKFVNDAAQGILWRVDAQIVKLNVTKVWVEEGKTTILFEAAS